MEHSIEVLDDDASLIIDTVRSKANIQSMGGSDNDLEVLEVRRNEIVDLSMEGLSSDISSIRWNLRIEDNLSSSPGRLNVLETQIDKFNGARSDDCDVTTKQNIAMANTLSPSVDFNGAELNGRKGSQELKNMVDTLSKTEYNGSQDTRSANYMTTSDALLTESDIDSAVTLPTSEDVCNGFTTVGLNHTVNDYNQTTISNKAKKLTVYKRNMKCPVTTTINGRETGRTTASPNIVTIKSNQENQIDCIPDIHPEGTINKAEIQVEEEPEAVVGSQNVLSEFPISSPVSQSQQPNEVPSGINLDLNLDLQNKGANHQTLSTKGIRKNIPALKCNKPGRKFNGKIAKMRVRRTKNKNSADSIDGIELNLTEFLEESMNREDEDFGNIEADSSLMTQQIGGSQPVLQSSSVLESHIFLPIHRSRTVGDRMGNMTVKNHLSGTGADKFEEEGEGGEEEDNYEVRKLRHYIVNSQMFSEADSKALIGRWHRENKQAFKKANQIYRDNETARSPIIMEVTRPLLQRFQSTEIDVKEVISPATLQESFRTDVPLIRFFRRCSSIYDINHDCYYPCDTKIIEEHVSILYYDAQYFFELYSRDKRTLYRVIRTMSRDGRDLILVLSNLDAFKRVIRKEEDQKFKAKVRGELISSNGYSNNNNNNNGGSRSSGNGNSNGLTTDNTKDKHASIRRTVDEKNTFHGFGEFDIEQRLRFIDRKWKVKIFTVNSDLEFLNSLPNLVSLIGKKRMDPALRFVRYSHINVRVGKDKTDIFRKTLQEVAMIPESKTRAIARHYSSFQELFHDLSEGRLEAGLDGRYLVSENMEKKIYNLFMCTDPNKVIT